MTKDDIYSQTHDLSLYMVVMLNSCPYRRRVSFSWHVHHWTNADNHEHELNARVERD